MQAHSWLLGTSVEHVILAQAALLKHFVKAPLMSVQTTLKNGHIINSVDTGPVVRSSSEEPVRTIVLAHGLGSGLGFFWPNYDALLRKNGGAYDRVIGVDWLGFGASSRPRVLAPRYRKLPEADSWWNRFSLCGTRFCEDSDTSSSSSSLTERSEGNGGGGGGAGAAARFFTDSFEEWRSLQEPTTTTTVATRSAAGGGGGQQDQLAAGRSSSGVGLERFTLLGHSLGGYLACRYAMARPQHIEGLVLASPAGLLVPPVGAPPSSTTTTASSANRSTAANSSTQQRPPPAGNGPGSEKEKGEGEKDVPWQFRLVDCAWSANVTPGQVFRAFSMVRQALRLSDGPSDVQRIVRGRFGEYESPISLSLSRTHSFTFFLLRNFYKLSTVTKSH